MVTTINNVTTVGLRASLRPPTGYDPLYSPNMATEASLMAINSCCLSIINVSCIIIFAYGILKIKEVVPIKAMSKETARFWKEDVPIAREYNRTLPRNASLGKEFLQEWAVSMLKLSLPANVFVKVHRGLESVRIPK